MIPRILLLTILIVFAVPAVSQSNSDARSSEQSEEAMLAAHLPGFISDPAITVQWNAILSEIAFAEDQFQTFKGVRAYAMMHIAMHDALNAVVPLYRQFAFHRREPFAHPMAAAAQAARNVVVDQYPAAKARVDAELFNWLSQIPNGPAKTRGVALGQKTAAAILALRTNDGWDVQGSYVFSKEPGDYQTTPQWNGFVLQPGFRSAKTFGLRAPDQFRPDPPPPLNSREYAEAFNEVKDFGKKDSSVRTLDQTRYAIWWMEFAEGSLNRLARQLVTERRTKLWRATRMFALLNMSLFDSYVANWDSKYEYNHWRPFTAIREAERDNNESTETDTNWEPLRTTPPFPEYVSAHSAVCSASFEILRRTYGDHVHFTMETTTAPPEMPRRSFRTFSAAAAECADSRVRLGFHFRYSTNSGVALGRAVAAWNEEDHLTARGTSLER
jgi:hypothetical protein